MWPVLFLCSFIYALILLPLLFTGLCEPLSFTDHLYLMAKSAIVALSWAFTYNAIARLPLSVSTSIRASAPLFTIFMAVTLMGERPAPMQWVGIIVTLGSYFCLSRAGKKELGHFFSNGWVISMFAGTFLAACSGVYDKFILQRMNFSPLTVQVWFSIYMASIQFFIAALLWFPRRHKLPRFRFRWSFLAVALLLILADRCYFMAVGSPEALISIITVLRRSSVLIGFAAGLFIFKERKSKTKVLALVGIIFGLCAIALG